MKKIIKRTLFSGKFAYLSIAVSLLFISATALIYSNLQTKNSELRIKAADVAQSGGITALQAAIDAAGDGETITIQPGMYSGPIATPIRGGLSGNRGGASTCFLQIENKNIIIKATGAMLYGEGHDKPNTEPYSTRAGICVYNSKVTFEGLHIKEFQSRAMIVSESQIVYKNGRIDGNDSGGISLLGNSKAIIINNLIAEMNFGGIMLWNNAQAKIINNTFYNGGIMFFYHSNSQDKIKADIINNIIVSYTNFGGRASITQVEWWKDQIPKLKENNVRTNLFWKGEFTCWDIELCDFPGIIKADPMFEAPVTDPRGVAAWASFGLAEGSPAIGAGDSSIPGPNNLGFTGGPCAEANSSTCSSFIETAKGQFTSIEPTAARPSEVVENPIDPYNPGNRNANNLPTDSPIPTKISTTKDVSPPPITYYLPPTINFDNPNQPKNGNPQPITDNPQPTTFLNPTPTITPIPKPLINVEKTIESAVNTWGKFVSLVIQFTNTVMP